MSNLLVPAHAPAGPAWSHGATIYQVNLDRYNFSRGQAFAEFGRHLPSLAAMGVQVLWFMPIHPRGIEKGFGSPYCIRDHREVNPDFGTSQDFRAFVQEAHRLGLRVMLDWVSNHTSWDNALITEHADWFKRDETGAITHVGPWKDIAQLDWDRREVWDWMRDAMLMWIRDFEIDGFRTDVADRVPRENAAWLRPQLLAEREVLLLAEADMARLHPAYDMTYSWNLPLVYWAIARGEAPASAMDEALAKEVAEFPAGAQRMRFLDNHDWHYERNPGNYHGLYERGELKRVEGGTLYDRYHGGVAAFAVLCATLPGAPLVYNGQEMGHEMLEPPRTGEERQASPVWNFYRTLLNLHREQSALHGGAMHKIPSANDAALFCFARGEGAQQVLVALNLSPQAQPWQPPQEIEGRWREVFSGSEMKREELEPWGFRVWTRGER